MIFLILMGISWVHFISTSSVAGPETSFIFTGRSVEGTFLVGVFSDAEETLNVGRASLLDPLFILGLPRWTLFRCGWVGGENHTRPREMIGWNYHAYVDTVFNQAILFRTWARYWLLIKSDSVSIHRSPTKSVFGTRIWDVKRKLWFKLYFSSQKSFSFSLLTPLDRLFSLVRYCFVQL